GSPGSPADRKLLRFPFEIPNISSSVAFRRKLGVVCRVGATAGRAPVSAACCVVAGVVACVVAAGGAIGFPLANSKSNLQVPGSGATARRPHALAIPTTL